MSTVSPFRFHEISESTHRIMNPLSERKMLLLGEIAEVRPGVRVLDLASGKGEMLCQFAARFGSSGVGIDIYPPFLEDARARAEELGLAGAVEFVMGDAGNPPDLDEQFDVVACIGATWIGGGLAGTLDLMKRFVKPRGWLLVGEVYWAEPPSAETLERNGSPDTFADLAGTLERCETAGTELVEMVLASHDDWDRYAASQWLNVADWLEAHPDEPEAREVEQTWRESRRAYLAEERRCLSWGVFLLRLTPKAPPG